MTHSGGLSAERLGVAIVGCGLTGQKRAKALAGARLTGCADVKRERAEALAHTASDATASDDWRAVIALSRCALRPPTVRYSRGCFAVARYGAREYR